MSYPSRQFLREPDLFGGTPYLRRLIIATFKIAVILFFQLLHNFFSLHRNIFSIETNSATSQ